MGVMKSSAFPVLIILAVTISATLGFLAIGCLSHATGNSCLPSTMSAGACPPAGNFFAMAIHHLAGLKNLTLSVVGAFGFDLLLLAFSVSFSMALFVFKDIFQPAIFARKFSLGDYYQSQKFLGDFLIRLLNWLAVNFKRDPFIFAYGRATRF